MIWDLEERIEDAISAYLRTSVGGSLRIYEAGNFTEMQMPCAIVMTGGTKALSETQNWSDVREASVSVIVKTEWAHELNDNQDVIRTAREIHAQAKGAVMEALARSDLVELIIATQPYRVLFSAAQVTNTEPDISESVRSTLITVDVIASPAEAA